MDGRGCANVVSEVGPLSVRPFVSPRKKNGLAAAGGEFPFGFTRQTLAFPFAECFGGIPGDVDDGMVELDFGCCGSRPVDEVRVFSRGL